MGDELPETTISGILISEADLIELLAAYKLMHERSENPITLEEYKLDYPKTFQSAKDAAKEFLKSKGIPSTNSKPETE